MPQDDNIFPSANLAFFLKETNGYDKEQIEGELLRLIFQVKGLTHYDRANGGSFEDLEQEKEDPSVLIGFVSNIIESVYRLNETKNFDPYIIIDFSKIYAEVKEGAFVVHITWSILQDLSVGGDLEDIRLWIQYLNTYPEPFTTYTTLLF